MEYNTQSSLILLSQYKTRRPMYNTHPHISTQEVCQQWRRAITWHNNRWAAAH